MVLVVSGFDWAGVVVVPRTIHPLEQSGWLSATARMSATVMVTRSIAGGFWRLK
jgi:hypothetical protein